MNSFWDRLGISASVLCLVHCLLTPLLVLSVPLVGNIFSHQAFHLVIAVVVFPVAIYALYPGYKSHQNPMMLKLGAVGLVFMAIGIWAGFESENTRETLAMVCAGGFLTSAHLLNLRACRFTPAPGQPLRPHDHSSDATGSRTEPHIHVHENV